MLEVKTFQSDDPIIEDAVEEILSACRQHYQNKPPQGGIVTMPMDIDYKLVLEGIKKEYPNLELIGCSSYLQMSNDMDSCYNSILLCLFSSDEIEFSAGVARDLSSGVEESIERAVKEATAKSQKEPSLCITCPEALTVPGEYIVDNLQKFLGPKTGIVGGSASSNNEENMETREFYNTEILKDAAPFLLFCGPVKYAVGIASGCVPMMTKEVVTKSVGNMVYKIGELTACDYFKKYIGGDQVSHEYPLAIFNDEKSDQFVLRTALFHNLEEGSIHFTGLVPEGSYVSMTNVTKENLITGVATSIKEAEKNAEKTDFPAILVFSCVSREYLLGTRVNEEISMVKEAFSKDRTIFGYYAFGEIGPLGKNEVSRYNNHTMVTVLLG